MHWMHSTHFLLSRFQVAFTVWLAIVPLVSATPHLSRTTHSRKGLHFRDLSFQQRGPGDVAPAGFTSLGCFTDSPSSPTLTSGAFTDTANMTVGNCITICQSLFYTLSGVENGSNCFCSNVTTAGSASAPDSACNVVCAGNSSETCGGSSSLNIFSNGAPPGPIPTIVPSVEAPAFQLAGCYNDSNSQMTLSTQVTVQGAQFNNTVGNCIDSCNSAGFTVAGLEFASQCFCDHSIGNNGTTIDQNKCTLACTGDNTEACGGANAILVYVNG